MCTAMTVVPGIVGGGVDAVLRSLYKNGVLIVLQAKLILDGAKEHSADNIYLLLSKYSFQQYLSANLQPRTLVLESFRTPKN